MGLINIQNTNLENGITNRNAHDLFGSMAQPDFSRYHSFMDDFDEYDATEWIDIVEGTLGLVNFKGGGLRLQTGSNINTTVGLLKDPFAFAIELGRPTYFRVNLTADDVSVADTVILLGLADEILPLGDLPSNGIIFHSTSLSGDLTIFVRSNSVTVAAAADVGVLEGDTATTLEWYWDGVERCYYGRDGVVIGALDLSTDSPLGLLGPTASITNTDTGTDRTLFIDYLYTATERLGSLEP